MTKGLKICFISDGHSLYDDRMYWKQALSLQNNGYLVSMIVAADTDEKGTTEHGIEYYKVKRTSYSTNKIINFLLKKVYYLTHDKMLRIAESVQADVYHVQDYKPNDFIQKVKKLSHKPKLIYDAREPIDNNLKLFTKGNSLKSKFFSQYADYLQKKEYRKAKLYDLILTVDDGLKRRFVENVKNKKIEVIYNYTNQIGDRRQIEFKDKKFDAIYCGGISEVRGFYTIVKSTKLITEKKPDYKLLLLGNIFEQDLEDYLKEFIAENKLEENLIWIDHVRFDEVSNYYNQSKIGLNILYPFNAFQDIIQIKLFEYMNFGLPIITSNFGEMQRYVLNNNVGLSIDPFDEKQLAEAVLTLLSDKEKYMLFSENAIKAVDEKYNWGLMEKKLYLLYEELLNKK